MIFWRCFANVRWMWSVCLRRGTMSIPSASVALERAATKLSTDLALVRYRRSALWIRTMSTVAFSLQRSRALVCPVSSPQQSRSPRLQHLRLYVSVRRLVRSTASFWRSIGWVLRSATCSQVSVASQKVRVAS
jgi:hypothetical protein